MKGFTIKANLGQVVLTSGHWLYIPPEAQHQPEQLN